MENTISYRKTYMIEKLVLNKFFWIIAVGFFFIYPLSKSIQRQLPESLPVLYKLPAYSFMDENKKAFGSNELHGKVYIANFIFTSCQTECPKLLGKIQKVQHRMRGVIDRAAIVSFTVDPQFDNSQVLFEKAREMKANPHVWRFLTAPLDDVKKLLVEGFKVPVGEQKIAENVMDIAHSNKLVLVDQEGQIRGYYNADDDGINQLMIDTGLLINRVKKT